MPETHLVVLARTSIHGTFCRATARDGNKQVQEQLDTIRDMLNPRQRANMRGILTRSRSNANMDSSIVSNDFDEDTENEVACLNAHNLC